MDLVHIFSCLLVVTLLGGQSSPSWAQEVYVIRGKNGPEFSNVPQPGAKEVILRPLTVIAPPNPASPTVVLPSPVVVDQPPTIPEYRSFSIVFPEDRSAVAAGTAVFEVRLAVDPPLQLERQHTFSIVLNGRQVRQRYTSTEFMIPPEFWNDSLPADGEIIELAASIVDGGGRLLRRASPVRFVMRRALIRNYLPGFGTKPLRPPLTRAPPVREETHGQAVFPARR